MFGGGGGFAFYACRRFGSKNVTYNDHNHTVANLITTLRDSPADLHGEYQRHFVVSDPDHYLAVRDMDLNWRRRRGRQVHVPCKERLFR